MQYHLNPATAAAHGVQVRPSSDAYYVVAGFLVGTSSGLNFRQLALFAVGLPFAPLLPALLYAIGAEYGFPAFASPEEEYQEAPAEVLVGGLVEAT